ncbi:phage tail length tape measure family protein [Acidiphilium sp. PA]|uniref:phage tail length tape measure family protein n=1 Tax=Acidiphilium sp. PA TaxID=2871705 RepID=UPI002243D935|nr:phage tail length tape measure family protein [Acidiphilium sp. PA]MCW8308393.1 phage tail length tape measure family protein [Acidiphilium sp. PA]
MVETAEVIISAHATGTSQVAALRAEIGKLDLSTVELSKAQRRAVDQTVKHAESMAYSKTEILAARNAQLGLTDALGPVTGAMRDAELAAAAMGTGVTKAAHHAEMGFKKMLTSGRSLRELIVLFHEVAIMGNYSRFGGSLMVEAEQLNLSEVIASAGVASVALGGLAAEVAAVGAGMVLGEMQSARFARGMQLTGNVAGITEGQFNTMAETIGRQIPGGVLMARAALNDLIRTGQFTGATLQDVTRAAVEFARVSGEKATKVVADFAKMGDGVAKWALKANHEYHFLDLAQYEYIATLEKQGHKEQAERAVANDLYHSLGTDAPRNLGYLIEALHEVRNEAIGAVDALESIGRTTTLSDQIASLKHQITDRGVMSRFGGGNTTLLQDRLHRLQIEQIGNQSMAAARGVYAQQQSAAIDSYAATQKHAARGTSDLHQHTAAIRDHVATLRDASGSGAVSAADRFNTILRTQNAEVQNQIATLQADSSHATAAALSHRQLADALATEAWARKEIAKYPAMAPAITAAMTGNVAAIANTSVTGAPATTPMHESVKKTVHTVSTASNDIKQIWAKTWSGMSDQLTTALEGGRVTFRSFAASIFKDMTSMVVQQAIVSPLSTGLGSLLKGLGGAGSIADMFSGGTKGGSGGSAFSGSMGNIGWGGGQQPTMPSPTGSGSILGDALGAAKSGLGFINTITGIGSLFSKGSSLMSAASDIGPVLGTIGKFFGFANGGIMTPMGPMPLHAYSSGGVASSPQVAMYGEGRMPEAYVPLPDGRSIPVSMKGGGGGNHTFNINTHVHSDGTVTGDPQNSAAGLHTAIRAAIQHEMIRQKRDGGLMAMNGTGYG